MTRGRDWLLGLLLLAAVGAFIFFVMSMFFDFSDDGLDISSDKRLGLVEVEGVIIDSEQTIKQLERFSEAGDIVGIILRIDSPGGGVAASQEIYEAVKRVREKGKFVIASMASVAASGGFYIACGADTIMANPGTTTGSIGVIAQIMNMTELLNKIGIRFDIIKSGKYKDSGTPFRRMNEDDRRHLQEFVDDAFEQFIAVVSTERSLSKEEVLKYADGRVYTGQQAFNHQLIDLLGSYQDAVNVAKEVCGIEGKAKIVKPRVRKVTFWDVLFGDLEQYIIRFQTMPILRYQMIL